MSVVTLPPREAPAGMCANCYGPLHADNRTPRSLGLCEAAGCHRLCPGCGHEVWEHNPHGCLHMDTYRTADGDEDNCPPCPCVLQITDMAYGTHTREHYDYNPT